MMASLGRQELWDTMIPWHSLSRERKRRSGKQDITKEWEPVGLQQGSLTKTGKGSIPFLGFAYWAFSRSRFGPQPEAALWGLEGRRNTPLLSFFCVFLPFHIFCIYQSSFWHERKKKKKTFLSPFVSDSWFYWNQKYNLIQRLYSQANWPLGF